MTMEINQNYNKNDFTASVQEGNWTVFVLEEATLNYMSGDIKTSNTAVDQSPNEDTFYVAHTDSEICNDGISTFDTHLKEIENTGLMRSNASLPCGYYIIDSMPTKKETLIYIDKAFNEKNFETSIDKEKCMLYVKKEE